MKYYLELSKHRKARVWLKDLPAVFTPEAAFENIIEAGVETAIATSAAIEIWEPKGPFPGYGLLGATFTPNHSLRELKISVGVLEGGQAYTEAIALPPDIVQVGLRMEFAQSVFEGAAIAAREALSVAGDLTFSCAACGRTGSSRAILKRLASLVVRVIRLDRETLTIEALTSVFRD
jgi:hypothetical protein